MAQSNIFIVICIRTLYSLIIETGRTAQNDVVLHFKSSNNFHFCIVADNEKSISQNVLSIVPYLSTSSHCCLSFWLCLHSSFIHFILTNIDAFKKDTTHPQWSVHIRQNSL